MSLYGFYNPGVFLRPYLLVDNNISRPRLFRASLNSPYFRLTARNSYDDASASTNRKFEVICDVGNFKPEEIKVTIANEDGRNVVMVEVKRETNEGQSNSIPNNSIFKKYFLPKECDVSRVESQLATDGILTIIAPYDPRRMQRNIPILQTGEPSRRGAVQSVSAKAG